MSIVSASESSRLSSQQAPRNPARSSSRLHVCLMIEKPMLAEIVAEVIRLAERLMPGVPHFLVVDGDSVILRLRQGSLRVCQTDILVCRLARTRGIRHVSAEQKTAQEGIIYKALLRGRSWSAGC